MGGGGEGVARAAEVREQERRQSAPDSVQTEARLNVRR